MPLFQKVYDTGRFPISVLALESVLVATVGIGFGFVLFPSEASIIGVFLIAMGQSGTVRVLLDRNRDDIWSGKVPPTRANMQLALRLLVLFVGALATYAVATLVVPLDRVQDLFGRQLGGFAGQSLTTLRFGNFGAILGHNMLVMLACLLFSLAYRHGGMLLVLAWNASVWGSVFAYIARTAVLQSGGSLAGYVVRSMICILPHLLLEALGYVLIAMAGVFASKALVKYRLESDALHTVIRAAAGIAAVALCCVFLAALTESFVAQTLVAWLF